MKWTRPLILACCAAFITVVAVGNALATPNPNSAVIKERIFNDCGTSTVTTGNTYPAEVFIDDALNCPGGFANLHNWRFSEDGVNPVDFGNGSHFVFGADLVISGTGNGEAGLQVAPWYSQDVDGRFNVRTTDGEIACFGGRLPFYSFSGSQGVFYTKGDLIHLEIDYQPNGLIAGAPATIEYKLSYLGNDYTSGALPFDKANPAEDPPYGLWGILNEARVGGHLQAFVNNPGQNVQIRATWSDIQFAQKGPKQVVPAASQVGLVILVLALLTAGTVWGLRRRAIA